MLADAKAIGVACGGANALQIEANASGANKEIRDDMTVCFVCAIGFQQVQLNCQQLETDSWWCWFPSLGSLPSDLRRGWGGEERKRWPVMAKR